MTTTTARAPSLGRWLLAARLVTLAVAVAAALATWWAWSSDEAGPRLLALAAAIATAFLAFVVWALEERRESALRGEAASLEALLQAERVRIATITNGAFLSTLAALQDLAGLDADERRTTVSGFRQKVV